MRPPTPTRSRRGRSTRWRCSTPQPAGVAGSGDARASSAASTPNFVLPAASPQGQYRVLVHDDAGQNYQGGFLVREYRLEPVRLVVDTPRRVYYRGEPIEGTIRAEFYYGAPLAGREIRYQLADDRAVTATTDAKGEVHFKLATREFSETQVLRSGAAARAEPDTAVNFVLAAQGFSVGVSTVRPVYVAGETFETTVGGRRTPRASRLAQKLQLKVLRADDRRRQGGRAARRRASAGDGRRRPGPAHAETGKGRQLRRPRRGHRPLPQPDHRRMRRPDLRRRGQRAAAHPGRPAHVQGRRHGRGADPLAGEPALGLVTFQGARVLDYRLVQLHRRASIELAIPMTAQLRRTSSLAVAVMTDPRPDKVGAGETTALREADGALT